MREGTVVSDVEVGVVKEDGRTVWTSVSAAADRRAAWACRRTTDITGRKARERELERLNRLYAALAKIRKTVASVQSCADLSTELSDYSRRAHFNLVWIGWRVPHTRQNSHRTGRQ